MVLLSGGTSKMSPKVPSVFALIPARSGSKGVPDKNIRTLGQHPLIEWSIAACLAASRISRTIVSTDSNEYAQFSKKMGADVPFLRPASLSGDFSTDYQFIKHALDYFAQNGGEPDYIAHIRPTTPLRSPELIDQAIKAFIENPMATALRSVHPMGESAYKTFEIVKTGQLKQIGSVNTSLDGANEARQIFPTTYIANGYVDVLSTAFIRKTQWIHGDRVMPFITPVVGEVDTEDDFKMLQREVEIHPHISTQLFRRD